MGITVEDFVAFCERTIEGHLRAVDRLSDGRANRVPDVPGANTPFQIVTHAFAACEWWCAHVICGQPIERVRDDEFASAGTVADLHSAANRLRLTLHELMPALSAATELAHEAVTTDNPLDGSGLPGQR